MKPGFLAFFVTLLVVFSSLSCGIKNNQQIKPLYKPESITLNDITVDVPTKVGPIPIERSGIRKFISAIPLLGMILELPVDLTAALLPNLPFNEETPIPDELWKDPEFLKSLKSIRLKSGYIRELKNEELTPKQKREHKKGWYCLRRKGLSFVDDMVVYLRYKDKRFENSPVREIVLANARYPEDYTQETRSLDFRPTGVNVREFVDDADNFSIRVGAKGGYPCRSLYIEANFKIELVISVKPQQGT